MTLKSYLDGLYQKELKLQQVTPTRNIRQAITGSLQPVFRAIYKFILKIVSGIAEAEVLRPYYHYKSFLNFRSIGFSINNPLLSYYEIFDFIPAFIYFQFHPLMLNNLCYVFSDSVN